MSLGTSLLLIAIGAILRYAVTVTTKGFSIHTIGLILMIVGIVGAVLSFLWLMFWSDRTAADGTPREWRRRREPPDRDIY